MEDFIPSLLPLLRRYLIEFILLASALIITVISLFLFIKENSNTANSIESLNQQTKQENKHEMITAEVSGSVKSPGIYHVVSGTRLQELIRRAGGLSQESDADFFSRNFNLARYVVDQDKIHVPSRDDVIAGAFKEHEYVIDYRGAQQTPQSATVPDVMDDMVHINSAMTDELEALQGIGPTTAAKIIQLRPYILLEELVTKKAVSQKIFDQIKSQIAL